MKGCSDRHRICDIVLPAIALFLSVTLLLPTTFASIYSSLPVQSSATITAPPIILQNGTTGTSTIYANNTSAKIGVKPPLFDYVDNNNCDMDSSADRGMHSNFTGQQYGPDLINDTLSEENTQAIQDYVDNNISDVDSSADISTHSNFENQKLKDGNYDNLTESATGGGISRIGANQGQGATGSPAVSFTHTLSYGSGNNRLVIVGAAFEHGSGDINVNNATYNGVLMTKIVQNSTEGTGYVSTSAIFYLLDASLPTASGNYPVVINLVSNPSRALWGCAVSYIGVKQEAPDYYDWDMSTSATIMTSEMTCAEDRSMMVQIATIGNTGDFQPSSGTTEVIEDSDINSAAAVFNEKLQQDTGARNLGCTNAAMNRGAWVGACWAPAPGNEDYDLDLEVQFTDVIDFLVTEKLCIYAGTLGNEDLRVDYWNGTGWENLATDLNAYSCGEFVVSLTSQTFTIRFKSGTTSGDTTKDQWQIDASLLRVEGAGSKEDAVDNDTSNIDGSVDVGTLSNFDNMKMIDGMANLTEGAVTVWLWQEDTSQYSAYSGADTYQFWSSWTTNSTTSGTITKIGIYVFANPGNSPQVKLGIYNDSGGVPNYLIGQTDVATITGVGWLDLPIIGGGVSISPSTTYHVASITDIVPTNQWRYRKTASPVSCYRTDRIWPNLIDPAGSTTASTSSRYGAYRVGYDEYRLDQEVQWTNISYSLSNEELCIYGGTMGAENIEVAVWNGTGWQNVFNDLSANWNNVSITTWLASSNFTIRFKGGTETGDSSSDTWQVDVALVHIWQEGEQSYEINLEVQWTHADYGRTKEELCIKTGTFSGFENIQVRVWNSSGSSWNWVMNLTANQWNNMSITSYLTASAFTVSFLGGTETGDTSQDSWNIDAVILHVWTEGVTYDYVLRVNNTVADSFQIRLRKYADSNISRLQDCNIYFRNSTNANSTQIIIENSSFNQTEGPWYNLSPLETIYIAMTSETDSFGTSHIYVYLEVRSPYPTTYAQYIMTFEIT